MSFDSRFFGLFLSAFFLSWRVRYLMTNFLFANLHLGLAYNCFALKTVGLVFFMFGSLDDSCDYFSALGDDIHPLGDRLRHHILEGRI